MYLRLLEITGFKSFADKTKIEFDQGITAVVGPNGSGKSNITEALRWVLGEQSAKSLRGGKMPDVIFSGTEKRKAMNFAEVVAHFENSDRYLEMDEDDVVITRRLYRNGDSDYLINDKKKRLRDIHDLFMDTGTGRDSLSIISQGRIESIFNAKPEDRRAIFEEAAGVLKYKTRKNETESKLTSTQDNLDRLEDIIFELNGQLTPLRAQRDVALKFQEFEADRQKLQLSVLVAQIKQELEKRQETVSQLTEVKEKLQRLARSQENYESALTELKNQHGQAELSLETATEKILQLTTLKSDLEKKVELFDAEKSNAEKSENARAARATQIEAERKTTQDALTATEGHLSALTEDKKRLDAEIAQLTEELAAFSESPETLLERLREDYLQLVSREANLSNNLTRSQAEAAALQKREAESDNAARETAEKLKLTEEESSAAEEEFATLKAEIAQLLNDFATLNEEDKTAATALDAAQQLQFSAIDSLKNKKARLNSLIAIRENHTNLYAGVAAVMKAQISGTIGVVADLLTFDQQYAAALEVALGAGAQNIIVEDEAAARASIDYLRKNRLGRATFLPLTTIKPRDFRDLARVRQLTGFVDVASSLVSYDARLTDAIKNLLGATIIVDSLENAQHIARELHFNVRIVTLDGSQINPGGSFAGGAGRRNGTTFTANEIAQLEEDIARGDEQLKQQEKEVQELTAARAAVQEKSAVLRHSGEEKRLLEREMEVKIKTLSQTRDDLQELLTLSGGQDAQEQLAELAAHDAEIAHELTEIVVKKQQLEDEQARVRDDSTSFNALKDEKSQALTAAKVQLSELTADLRHEESEKLRLTETLETLDAQLLQLTSASSSASDTADREAFSRQLLEVTDELQQLQIRQVSLRLEREDVSAQMDELAAQNSMTLLERETLAGQEARLEVATEQVEQGLKSRQLRLSEDYQLSFDAAAAQVEMIEDLSVAERHLRDLERQIRSLGPVNLDAIAQFDEVNSRYNFLNGQKSDLLGAKELLLSNINEMDDVVRARFEKTFYEIKNSFLLTFKQMFGGGTADLVLTSDDLLTAGIEIQVQPPGKKLASLQLMSGGEKALTALALLFAILRVRTVPFVVLDEVEAALDEANVKRFGDYMNHFDSSNQFIVVTHRKGTMAAADVMYGVTMLDAGVSKLVSVRFDEVDETNEKQKVS